MRLPRVWRRLRRDDGFSLIEITIAGGAVATALSMVAAVVTSSVTATAYSRERQSATEFANKTLEQVRALPYDAIQGGLGDTDLASTTDPNITTTGCGGSYCFGGEQIAHGPNATVDPLVPHRKTVTVGV